LVRISADTKYWLMRIGSVAGIVGSTLAGVGNVLLVMGFWVGRLAAEERS